MADDDYEHAMETSIPYNVIATLIFVFMSSCLFFPNNDYIPLDRRTASCIAGTMCYVTRNFLFPNNKMNVEEAVDFDVLLLLAAIMCINYIVVNQKETLAVVEYVQDQIRDKPRNGFWLVSFAAFCASPFLTNDGVCLLFVEPILNAFSELEEEEDKKKHGSEDEDVFDGNGDFKLQKSDALYFMLGLACSSNLGSALTYTGNPQVCESFLCRSIYISYLPNHYVEYDCLSRCLKRDAALLVFGLHAPAIYCWLADNTFVGPEVLDEKQRRSEYASKWT